MFGGYDERVALEDELYREESEGSEVDDSELEFRLYSQLHYSSNPGEREEEEEEGEEERRLSSSHGNKDGEEEEEHRSKAKRQQPSQSRDHGNRDLRQHLLGETEQKNKKVKQKNQQCMKQQRGLSKGNPKGQRSLQEVIVIDSSHDEVITVSDNTEEDDGVCRVKGQRSKTGPLQASTPAPQRNSAPKRRNSTVDSDSVVLLDSESGADSGSGSESESRSESDSDCLENWMILGSEKQDGDQSIILNLEGDAKDGDDDEGSWLVSDKDREAQIINRRGGGPPVRRVANRYYADKKVTCHSCNKTGHLSKNCPTPREPCCMLCGEHGHRMSSCPSKHCNNCGLPGHMYEACVGPNLRYKQCHRCGMYGHLNDACPEIWRQYHITTKSGPVLKTEEDDNARIMPPYCYNCSLRGHFGFDCSLRRMSLGIFPNSPFINHYDTPSELHKRDHRTQLRVKELKDAGLFQCQLSPDGGARDERAGKRQRTNSNHNNRPYQKYPPKRCHLPPYHSATPNSTHVRFSHGQEKPWTPKHKLKETREGKLFTPASATPKSNMADRNQKVQKKKQRKPDKNKMAADANESLDFPQGRGPSPKRKKKGNKGPPSSAGAPPPSHPKGPPSHTPDRLFGAAKKKKMRRENGRDRKAAKEKEMYPTDENLFLIKQRRSRR